MSSCFSRCLRVPIAIRAFYESGLWILQTLLLKHPDLHPGLLGWPLARNLAISPDLNTVRDLRADSVKLKLRYWRLLRVADIQEVSAQKRLPPRTDYGELDLQCLRSIGRISGNDTPSTIRLKLSLYRCSKRSKKGSCHSGAG
jgi:hypothetical protein